MPEWSRYDFDPSEDTFKDGRIGPLYHIVHIDHAIRILQDNKISSRPVYDESRLNKSRLHVVWTSPNEWCKGSFYGNIRFHFDFDEIVRGKKFYWVEAIEYSPPAPRILVSNKSLPELSVTGLVDEYDPLISAGPLKYTSGEWWYNKNTTLELMVEGDVDLSLCHRVDVIDHHHYTCRLHGSACKEFRREKSEPGAELLGFLLGSECHLIDKALTTPTGAPPNIRFNNDLLYPIAWLDGTLRRDSNSNGPVSRGSEILTLIKAASLMIASGNIAEARKLKDLISTEGKYDRGMTRLIQEHFDLGDVNVLLR